MPFIHKNLEIKNELIELARKLREGDFKLENALASVVIYSNIAEYLAEHLLENLNYLVKESSYKYFSGFVYIASTYSTERNMTLGTYIHELRKFSFPDKENILGHFRNICEARNRIFHNFARSDIEEIKKFIDNDLPGIQDECEELLKKMNIVYDGLQKLTVMSTPNK